MAPDWDPSREYDSQTYSEDYNLHGASGRSIEHDSVTQDEPFHYTNLIDDKERNHADSIDYADLQLMANIVDGKANNPRAYSRSATSASGRRVPSVMKHLVNDSQVHGEYEESPDYAPARYHNGLQVLERQHGSRLVDDVNENYFGGWSGNNPNARRQQTKQMDFKPPASRLGTPVKTRPRINAAAAAITSIPSPRRLLGEKTLEVSTPPLKPVFHSAMKSTNSSHLLNSGQPTKSKLGRHIQLPTEILDDDDEEEDEEVEEEQEMEEKKEEEEDQEEENFSSTTPESRHTEPDPPPTQQQEDGAEHEPSADEAPAPIVNSIPGPSRFTRISKTNSLSTKRPIATIPTPKDDDNEVQNAVKELKATLKKIGLLPLSSTLEMSLSQLDSTTMEKGGLCETLWLLQKLGSMYERQNEVIHKMTDQIIAGETQTKSDPDAEERVQEMGRELQGLKAALGTAQERKENLVAEVTALNKELERSRQSADNKATQPTAASPSLSPSNTKKQFIDAESQVSGNWNSIEDFLGQQLEGLKSGRSKMTTTKQQDQSEQTSDEAPANFRKHIHKVEQEVQAPNMTMDQHSELEPPLSGVAEQQIGELKEKLNYVTLENRRLKRKNKSRIKELLSLYERGAAEDEESDSKHKEILKTVMTLLEVDEQEDILPALREIVDRDLPDLRRFVAKVKRIIWESDKKRFSKYGEVDTEAMLKQLQWWKVLEDVVNHLEAESVQMSRP
ncbi:hypothetical protein EDD11_004998 [Mortierella claussenii]|nr:hypothetical protein EDD11_004998 [Mortierella claussenii]